MPTFPSRSESLCQLSGRRRTSTMLLFRPFHLKVGDIPSKFESIASTNRLAYGNSLVQTWTQWFTYLQEGFMRQFNPYQVYRWMTRPDISITRSRFVKKEEVSGTYKFYIVDLFFKYGMNLLQVLFGINSLRTEQFEILPFCNDPNPKEDVRGRFNPWENCDGTSCFSGFISWYWQMPILQSTKIGRHYFDDRSVFLSRSNISQTSSIAILTSVSCLVRIIQHVQIPRSEQHTSALCHLIILSQIWSFVYRMQSIKMYPKYSRRALAKAGFFLCMPATVKSSQYFALMTCILKYHV